MLSSFFFLVMLGSCTISVEQKDAGELEDQNSTSKMPSSASELPCSLKREVKSDTRSSLSHRSLFIPDLSELVVSEVVTIYLLCRVFFPKCHVSV